MNYDPAKQIEEFVRQYQAGLRAFLFSRTNNKNTAEDLAQEVFLIAFQKIETFDTSRPAWPWLLGIAKNKLRKHWNQASWRSEVDSIEEYLLDSEFVGEFPSTESDERERYLEALEQCMASLPDRSRTLLDLIYEKRLTCEHVAAQMSKQAGAIRITLHRLRAVLLGCVEERLAE